jgi:hypothetical protein
MLTRHTIERLTQRMTPERAALVASAIDRLASTLPSLDAYGVRVMRDTASHGTLTIERDGSGESNGTDLWAIIRGRRVVTVMWRRPAQPATREALRVDHIGHVNLAVTER